MREAEDLTCAEMVELVTDYLEGALEGAGRAAFAAHLGECEPCSRYVEQIRITVELTGRLREEELSPETKAALVGVFRGSTG